MKTSRDSVSGTGNGVDIERLQPFVAALKDFEKLIHSVVRQYEEKPRDQFGGHYGLLNNWHNTYKISLRAEEFPFHLTTGIDPYYCGWNSVIFISRWPLKFKAPTFSGEGETENMSVAFTAEVSLGQNSMQKFMNNKLIPEWVKVETLRELEKMYTEKVKTRYEADVNYWHSLAESKRKSIEDNAAAIAADEVEIPIIEKRIKSIQKLLAKY